MRHSKPDVNTVQYLKCEWLEFYTPTILNLNIMKEFDYGLDYKTLDFTDEETRKLYRIGRGEQGVLLVLTLTTYVLIGGL